MYTLSANSEDSKRKFTQNKKYNKITCKQSNIYTKNISTRKFSKKKFQKNKMNIPFIKLPILS